MTTKAKVSAIVRSALQDLAKELQKQELENASGETRLIGESSPIDSMALVSLIVDIETRIHSQLGRQITLVDESAMSAYRSPFRTVNALEDHVVKLISSDTTVE